jgi:hypothetical protein
MTKISIIGPGAVQKAPETEDKKPKAFKVYMTARQRHEIEERMRLRQFSALGPYLLSCERELTTTQEQIRLFKAYLAAKRALEAALLGVE